MLGRQVSGIVYQGVDLVLTDLFVDETGDPANFDGVTPVGTISGSAGTTLATFDLQSFVFDSVTGRATAKCLGSATSAIPADEPLKIEVKTTSGPYTRILWWCNLGDLVCVGANP